MKVWGAAAALVAAGLISEPADAAAIWAFQETGGNVVGTLSGSLDVSGISPLRNATSYGAEISPATAQIIASGPFESRQSLPVYAVTGPTSFGANSFASGTVVGDKVELFGFLGSLFLPVGYAGGPLSTVLTFTNTTFASIGVTPGDHVFSLARTDTLPGDTLTVRFIASQPEIGVVPLPATLPMLAGGLLAGWALRRRRR